MTNQMEIEELTNLTMELGKLGKSEQNNFLDTGDEDYSLVFDSGDEIKDDLVPELPGLLYWIKEGVSTFSIQTLPSLNLSKDLELIKSGKSPASLRFDEDAENLKFFVLPNIDIAEQLELVVSSKRFPIFEERMCNLGDPGYSWWLKFSTNSLQLSFKNKYSTNDDGLVKLGPIGDSLITTKIFEENKNNFKSLFSLKNLTIDEDNIEIFVHQDPENILHKLNTCFLSGDLAILESIKFEGFTKSFKFLITEIIALRSFWLEIEGQINNKS